MSDAKWTWTTSQKLASRLGAHIPLMDEILEQLRSLAWGECDLFGIQMALEESLANAIKHGNQLDEAKHVHVECKCGRTEFWIQVRDEGEGFDPHCVPDCTAPENLEVAGGRGLLLMQAYMNRVCYNEAGNCLTMEKTASSATRTSSSVRRRSIRCCFRAPLQFDSRTCQSFPGF